MVDRSHKSSSTFWDGPQAAEKPAGFPTARVLTGALYGLLLGALYALVAGAINAFIIRDVPMRVDWPTVRAAMVTTGLAVGLLGAGVAWPEEFWRGVILGGLAITSWSMLQSFARLQASALAFLPLFLPLAVMSLPIALILRWLAHRHILNLDLRGVRRLRAQALLLAATVAIGAFAGSWAQMIPAEQEAVRRTYRLLQRTLSLAEGAALPREFDGAPHIREHAGVPYALDARDSQASPTGLEVQAAFDDGYRVTCLVDENASLVVCVEGTDSVFGPYEYDANDQR